MRNGLTTLLAVVLALVAAANIMELVDVLIYHEFYPFGAEFFPPNSIYKSQNLFVAFKVTYTVSIITMLICLLAKFEKTFWVLGIVNILAFFYVMLLV